MAQKHIKKTVELKAGATEVVELGELMPDEQIQGHVKEENHDKFLFSILDEKNYKKFMEDEDAYIEDDEDMRVIAEGDGKGHYKIDVLVEAPGNHYLVLESTEVALGIKVNVDLMIE